MAVGVPAAGPSMSVAQVKTGRGRKKRNKQQSEKVTWKRIRSQRSLLFMIAPLLAWLVIFAYLPLVGWVMAFQDYKAHKGFFDSDWVGLAHFERLFSDNTFWNALKNTLAMGVMGLVFGTIFAIGFALLLNEMRFTRYKKITQTISYLPHFVSWVVVASIVGTMLSIDGPINQIMQSLGIWEVDRLLLGESQYFWWIVTLADVWKEMGWNAIIYLAAMVGISKELYEAASIDGASRFQKMRMITLPSIKPIIVVLLIISIGNLINIGFERQMLLGGLTVYDKAMVLDWYALGFLGGNPSYGTAIGIFKSVVSVILIFTFNYIAKKTDSGALV